MVMCNFICKKISLLYTFIIKFCPSQASKDAARYPVAAKVADLLVRGIVRLVFPIIFR